VNPRVGLADEEKRKFLTLPRLEFRPLGRPARSQSAIPTTISRLLSVNMPVFCVPLAANVGMQYGTIECGVFLGVRAKCL
jgi:hypothetical protein